MSTVVYKTFLIDPEAGLVIGLLGKPIGSHDTSGYLQVDARPRGLGILSAHRLIWEAVNGPIPDGKEINHINGVKDDNRISNLELTTRSGNIRHAYATGLKSNRGERHPNNKLTDVAVREIRRLGRIPTPRREIAARFGVTVQTVSHIQRRVTWTHLGDDDAN